MKKVFKSKKFNSFLLALILIFSMLFLSSCVEGATPSDTFKIKVVYKPFYSSKPSLESDTYGEIIYDSLIEVSSDILTRLVGEYGIGEINVKDGQSTKTASPDLQNIDFQALLDLETTPTDVQTLAYVDEFSNMTNIFYSLNDKMLVLSNYSVVLSNLITYDNVTFKYTSHTNLTMVSTPGGSVNSETELTSNKVYKYEQDELVAYIFVGGTVGANNFQSVANAKIYAEKFFKTHFNAIQKSFSDIPVEDGIDRNLQYSTWLKKLVTIDGDFSTPQSFLDLYVAKFSKDLAVEIAKTVLVGSSDFSDTTLNQMYQTAKTGTESQKDAFITKCCEYIDHLYLIDTETQDISDYIFSNFIGLSEASNFVFFKDYVNVCDSVLNETETNYASVPVLEYQTFNSNGLDEIEVGGFIQSIVFMNNGSFDFESILMEIESLDAVGMNFNLMLRHCKNGVLIEYPIAPDQNDVDEGDLVFSVGDVTEEDVFNISKLVDNTPSSSATSAILEQTGDFFARSNTVGTCWCYNDLSTDFVELSFGAGDVFSFKNFKILSCLL